MTNKHDYKDEISTVVAQAWCTPENEHKEMDVVLAETIISNIMKTTALSLADRLQSGDLGDDTRRVIENLMMACGCDKPIPDLEERFFKAMAAQMMKELEDERGSITS